MNADKNFYFFLSNMVINSIKDKFNGQKQGECCGKGLTRHTFNPAKLECCKDGSTKKIGQCKKDDNKNY